jgi:hypothetical protein
MVSEFSQARLPEVLEHSAIVHFKREGIDMKTNSSPLTGFFNHGFLALALLCLCITARAATVTVFGTDVKFTFDDSTLFGTGIAVGNSLIFQPTSFRAESLNGAGTDLANETLNIQVESITDNYVIETVVMQELGDYFLSGTDAEVTANGRLQVTSNTKTDGLFPYMADQIFNVGGLTVQNAATDWSGGATVDMSSIAGWGSDTLITAQMQNNLSATTLNNGETAWIQKKAGAVGLIVNPVPIPAAIWLFGAGLLGFAGVARRRRH